MVDTTTEAPRDVFEVPWEVDLEDTPEYCAIEIRAGGALIATVRNADDFPCLDEEDADDVDRQARRVACAVSAAPDLLQACAGDRLRRLELLILTVEQTDHTPEVYDSGLLDTLQGCRALLSGLQAAVAKARGEEATR